MDCHQKSVPPWNEIWASQLTPNPPDFSENKSKLNHLHSFHNRSEICRESLSDWLILILFCLYLYK